MMKQPVDTLVGNILEVLESTIVKISLLVHVSSWDATIGSALYRVNRGNLQFVRYYGAQYSAVFDEYSDHICYFDTSELSDLLVSSVVLHQRQKHTRCILDRDSVSFSSRLYYIVTTPLIWITT